MSDAIRVNARCCESCLVGAGGLRRTSGHGYSRRSADSHAFIGGGGGEGFAHLRMSLRGAHLERNGVSDSFQAFPPRRMLVSGVFENTGVLVDLFSLDPIFLCSCSVRVIRPSLLDLGFKIGQGRDKSRVGS